MKNFLNTKQSDFYGELAEKQWVIFFNTCNDTTRFTELLKICQYFFCIMPHNANIERIFSMMNSQWTKERNRLTVESIRAILITQYNMKHLTCAEFHSEISSNANFLKAVASGQKYNVKKIIKDNKIFLSGTEFYFQRKTRFFHRNQDFLKLATDFSISSPGNPTHDVTNDVLPPSTYTNHFS